MSFDPEALENVFSAANNLIEQRDTLSITKETVDQLVDCVGLLAYITAAGEESRAALMRGADGMIQFFMLNYPDAFVAYLKSLEGEGIEALLDEFLETEVE